jgi:DeoR family transcriptional regulator, fructose operon transcriptional repressor
MKYQIRKQKILEYIKKDKFIDVKTLVAEFNISEITVRRDLDVLASEGHLVRTHGGAASPLLNIEKPIGFVQKASAFSKEKDEICLKASKFIKEGDVVFLDCGSTVFRMCQFIKHLKIKVVTNSIPVLNELLGSEVDLNFAGGEIDAERQAAHGKVAIKHLKKYRADKAFIGVSGISVQSGLSVPNEKESDVALILEKYSKESYYLCDSTKLEQDRYFVYADIETVQNLITDSNISDKLLKKYIKAGVVVY